MALVPFSYNLRSLFVRRSATLLTALGIAATVAVVAGVLALQQGFALMFAESGRDDVVLFLRPGATNEGQSSFLKEKAEILIKSRPEIAADEKGEPLAAMECFLAVRRPRTNGGETNVTIRGVQPSSFRINAEAVKVTEGRMFTFGSDEVIVGRRLVGNFRDCAVGDVLVFNGSPFRVVGAFENEGPFASEIWGDLDRIGTVLDRDTPSRVVARLKPGVDLASFKETMKNDPQTPTNVMTEREYLSDRTKALSFVLIGLGFVLAVIMGTAAIFTTTNTMLAALSARTHEIGILLAVGFKPWAIFLSFLFESIVLALLGGAIGCILVQPINGIETSTSNFATFTDVSFAFRVSPAVLVVAVVFSLVLGVVGGAWPAYRAAQMTPTQALRRR